MGPQGWSPGNSNAAQHARPPHAYVHREGQTSDNHAHPRPGGACEHTNCLKGWKSSYFGLFQQRCTVVSPSRMIVNRTSTTTKRMFTTINRTPMTQHRISTIAHRTSTIAHRTSTIAHRTSTIAHHTSTTAHSRHAVLELKTAIFAHKGPSLKRVSGVSYTRAARALLPVYMQLGTRA